MFDAILALVVATAALLGSPGPAVLSLAAVGATSGVRNGLPYLAGILAGLMFVMLGAIAGLSILFARWPNAALFVQLAGAAYILFVAWKIATAPVVANGDTSTAEHPSFRDGFILNILNPKAYAAFLALFGQFLLPIDNSLLAWTLTATIAYSVAVLVDSTWLAAGEFLRHLFREPRSARITRIVFGLLIALVTLWMAARALLTHA